MAARAYSNSAWPLTMTNRVSGNRLPQARSRSMPVIPGMRMSVTTISGLRSSMSRRASRPLPATASTGNWSRTSSRAARILAATKGSSSTIKTRYTKSPPQFMSKGPWKVTVSFQTLPNSSARIRSVTTVP